MSTRITICGLLLSILATGAWAEVVVVVAVESPVERLSKGTLQDVYLGKRSRLANGEPIVPLDQREGTPAHGEFYQTYLGQSPAQIKAYWSKLIFTGRGQPPQSVANDQALAESISLNPDAIGYLDANMLDERLRMVVIE